MIYAVATAKPHECSCKDWVFLLLWGIYLYVWGSAIAQLHVTVLFKDAGQLPNLLTPVRILLIILIPHRYYINHTPGLSGTIMKWPLHVHASRKGFT